MRILFTMGVACLLALTGSAASWGWGDEGHEIVGLIADHYLDPGVRTQVHAMLAQDKSKLVKSRDIGTEATWADKYRDAGKRKLHYTQTQNWHFVDIELSQPDQDVACFGHPALPASKLASKGPTKACVVDKINQFATELADRNTPPAERLMALQFVLHFVGDVHQPLHAADNKDKGGNEISVSALGIKSGKLHHYWDTEFVLMLGKNPQQVADTLVVDITSDEARQWSSGAPTNWAQESFEIARDHAYKLLPSADAKGTHRLDQAYIDDAKAIVASQLSKAGVRLAMVLNKALAQ